MIKEKIATINGLIFLKKMETCKKNIIEMKKVTKQRFQPIKKRKEKSLT